MKREIFELDDLLVIEAAVVAKQQEKTLDEVVDAALREYIAAHRKPNRLPFIGMFEGSETSSDPEEIDRVLLDGIDPYEGWSPDSRERRSEEPSGAKS